MRTLLLVLAVALTPAISRAVDLRPGILREVRRCATAFQREDIAAVIGFLPSRVVQKRGGRAALINELKDQLTQAREMGMNRIEALPGNPAVPRTHGRLMSSLVPVTAVAYGAHVEVTQQTHILAVSADAGKHWSIIPLYDVSQAELNAWYPEFRGKVAVPVVTKPKMQLVY
ncbi:MAG: hypothetical protein ABIV50_06595 [Opitutus sp.]